jgi:hypothetical protein
VRGATLEPEDRKYVSEDVYPPQGNLYTIASGSVRHKAGKIGTITLYCPISPTITLGGGPFGGWFMTFVDPDGPGNKEGR